MSALNKNFFLDLVGFHRWGNRHLIELSEALSDGAFDAPAALGPGSLRATLVHLIEAQRIWLDRWNQRPSEAFSKDAAWSFERIRDALEATDRELQSFVELTDAEVLDRIVDYENLKRERYQHRLSDLILHVLNHAVHHRSQALNFLKRHGRTVPGGLDYIFFKLAYPTVLQRSDVAEGCRKYGIETGRVAVDFAAPAIELIARYQQYGDWAQQRVLDETLTLSDEQLDRDWSMGQGTLRKTLLHLYDAEIWWQSNWQERPIAFPRSSLETSIPAISEHWREMANRRLQLIHGLGQPAMEKIVTADFGSGPLLFRIAESMIQLCVHGTLHRAQANNMLRRLGRAVQALDYVVYIRETN